MVPDVSRLQSGRAGMRGKRAKFLTGKAILRYNPKVYALWRAFVF